MKDLTPWFPKLTYQLYFDKKTAEAVKELDADIRRSLRSTLRSKSSVSPPTFLTSENDFLGAYKDVVEVNSVSGVPGSFTIMDRRFRPFRFIHPKKKITWWKSLVFKAIGTVSSSKISILHHLTCVSSSVAILHNGG